MGGSLRKKKKVIEFTVIFKCRSGGIYYGETRVRVNSEMTVLEMKRKF